MPDDVTGCEPAAPLSPARGALRAAIELLAAASTELTEAHTPEQRLFAIVSEPEAAERDLTACRVEDDRVPGAWLADAAEGERTRPSARTLADERAVGDLGRNAIAARAALPKHQAKVLDCSKRVRDLGIAHRDAAYRTAVKAVREFLDAEFAPAIQHLLAIKAKARGVEQALDERSHGANPSSVALTCSVDVATAIREANAAAGVPRDHETGKWNRSAHERRQGHARLQTCRLRGGHHREATGMIHELVAKCGSARGLLNELLNRMQRHSERFVVIVGRIRPALPSISAVSIHAREQSPRRGSPGHVAVGRAQQAALGLAATRKPSHRALLNFYLLTTSLLWISSGKVVKTIP
jgi:hypothetical protein